MHSMSLAFVAHVIVELIFHNNQQSLNVCNMLSVDPSLVLELIEEPIAYNHHHSSFV